MITRSRSCRRRFQQVLPTCGLRAELGPKAFSHGFLAAVGGGRHGHGHQRGLMDLG